MLKMYQLFFLITLLVANFIQISDAANVLFFLGVSIYSHRIVVSPLAERMAERGDNVTIFCPLVKQMNQPNVTEFYPKVFQQVGNEVVDIEFVITRVKEGRIGNIKTAATLPQLALSVCQRFLNAPETQGLLSQHFDLVIIDSLFNDCAFGLAHKFQAKTIIVGMTTVMGSWYDAFGFLPETSWLTSEVFAAFSYPFNFIERVLNTLMPIFIHEYFNHVYYPALEDMLRTKLDMPDMPPLSQLFTDTSLVLLNTHFSEEEARSLPPFIIPVSGIHMTKQSQSPIPSEVLEFIKGAGSDGFIYVGFGSGAKISQAPIEIQNVFFTAFNNTQFRYLWKWEGKRPAGIPPNVFTAEWLPQEQILEMGPRAFITHGGVLSLQEAAVFGVPVILLPIFADQDYTSFRTVRKGRGIRLEISTLTVAKFESAIHEILNNKTYKNNMIEAGMRFKDRPREPIDEAMWWVDYVLRHKDTKHLHPLGRHQSWFIRRSLDVWLFVFLFLACTFGAIASAMKLVYYYIGSQIHKYDKIKVD